MGTRVLVAAFAFSLVPIGAFAQDGLRSASLPERHLTPLPGERSDLFRAAPDTYIPHPDQRPPFNPGYVIGGFWPYASWSARRPSYRAGRARGSYAAMQTQPEWPRVALPVSPPEKYVAGVPGKPKTFYVIPGCYAGDRRPQADRLPPGCDASRVREIPAPAI